MSFLEKAIVISFAAVQLFAMGAFCGKLFENTETLSCWAMLVSGCGLVGVC